MMVVIVLQDDGGFLVPLRPRTHRRAHSQDLIGESLKLSAIFEVMMY